MANLAVLLNESIEIHEDGTAERWRDVPGYEGLYRISDWGRIKSLDKMVLCCHGAFRTIKGRMRIPHVGPQGHLGISITKNGVPKYQFIHCLVLGAFVGPKPDGMQCCHFPDRNPANNRLENLRWDTVKANAQDREKHGMGLKGEDHPISKLTEQDVVRIRHLHSSGKYTGTKLAILFGVTSTRIYQIVKREAWIHVT